MSAASEPAPRSKSSADGRPLPPRHTLFLPMLILLLGLGLHEIYLISALEDQLDLTTQNVDKLDDRVKVTIYERSKFYTMASEVLRLAPKDPNADKVAVLFGLRKLQVEKPDLMNASAPSDLDTTTKSQADPLNTTTNTAAPVAPPSTNALTVPPGTPAIK